MIVDRGGELPASFRHQPAGGVLDFGLEPLLEGAAAEPGRDRGAELDDDGAGPSHELPPRPEQPRIQPEGTQATPVPR